MQTKDHRAHHNHFCTTAALATVLVNLIAASGMPSIFMAAEVGNAVCFSRICRVSHPVDSQRLVPLCLNEPRVDAVEPVAADQMH
jgi:hypothetical protein